MARERTLVTATNLLLSYLHSIFIPTYAFGAAQAIGKVVKVHASHGKIRRAEPVIGTLPEAKKKGRVLKPRRRPLKECKTNSQQLAS